MFSGRIGTAGLSQKKDGRSSAPVFTLVRWLRLFGTNNKMRKRIASPFYPNIRHINSLMNADMNAIFLASCVFIALRLYLANVILASHKRFFLVPRFLADAFRFVVKLPHARLGMFGPDGGIRRVVPVLAERAPSHVAVDCVEILHRFLASLSPCALCKERRKGSRIAAFAIQPLERRRQSLSRPSFLQKDGNMDCADDR